MSWIDISVGSGSSGSGSGNNLLSALTNSLGNALSNASSSSSSSGGYPKITDIHNTLIFRDYENLFSYLNAQNALANQRLQNAFKRVLELEKRFNQLHQEINNTQERINSLNNEINRLNHQILQEKNQAIDNLNQEIAALNNEISTNRNAIKQEQDKLNALELQTSAKKQVLESLKQLEELKQELERLKKQSKWKKQFNFLTDNPPNIEAQQQSALNRSSTKNALTNFFLTDPYAILPKGFIYEYHNPGKETYNALNAPNNMDGINNQFRINALNQVLDNSYQKFLPGNDSYNALGDIQQVKALKFHELVLDFNLGSENLESALFFKQISQYAKGLRHKILTSTSTKKELERLEKLEKNLNQLQEQLQGKDLNTMQQEIQKEQENALKLKESIKSMQNNNETLTNAINQKEQAKNHIQQQKQNLENQKQPLEQQKQNQESAKWQKEQQKQNLNNEINSIGNERVTMKKEKDLYPQVSGELRATIIEKSESVREYYQKQKRIYEILGFFGFEVLSRIQEFNKRMAEVTPEQQKELTELIL
ncbi:UV radiation resistance protein [Helicobacter pylori]|uniref:UV radiation resistance protein n=1 Tax=Helicobacter pylori TaxID=210 RepID=UPI000FDE0F14|nr:UV radiation resistance protein [Helicobacter pylori]RVZ36539.1 UV radiation resistance protein [Helicobacter pylori]RVZ75310.1 UV radiation resistance protein [Helicobacter pylori]